MKRSYHEMSPSLQTTIANEYQWGVRGHGIRSLANKYQVSRPTVQHIIERAKLHRGQPASSRGHKKQKLSASQISKMKTTLQRNPQATNQQLAASVNNAIRPRTVSDYLLRSQPPYTRKQVSDHDPGELTPTWKLKARRWLNKVKKIRMDIRVYQDESAVYANEAPKRGRSPRGKRITRTRSHYAKKYTLHAYAKRTGVVHWELSKLNANTAEVERVATAAAKMLDEDDVVIWDRLGRSGTTLNPVKQHWSPVALSTLKAHCSKVEFLPPMGKYFQPLELLFNDLKEHHIRPQFPKNGQSLTEAKLNKIIGSYMANQAPHVLPAFFKRAANGREAFEKNLL